jgi:hypothetical protein
MEQVKATTTTVLETILSPLLPLLREQCAQLKDDANTYKLSLEPFVLNLVFAVLNNIKSISLPQEYRVFTQFQHENETAACLT